MPRDAARLTLGLSLAAAPMACQGPPVTAPDSAAPEITIWTEAVVVAEAAAPEVPLAPATEPLARALDETLADWAIDLLVVESTGAPVQSVGEGEWVQLQIPIRIRIDEARAASWAAEASVRLAAQFGTPRQDRLLVEGQAGRLQPPLDADLPVRTSPPHVHIERAALATPERAGSFGLLLADRPSWGASVASFRVPTGAALVEVLSRTVAPHRVEMLVLDRRGGVLHGATLPLIPSARVPTGDPQALICPWWIRDRRDEQDARIRWRNAQEWLAPNRTLAAAMLERPETLGDLLFLPMVGWQRNGISAPLAVGAIEMRIGASVPRSIVGEIAELVFRISR